MIDTNKKPPQGSPGTSGERPRWEGPPENRPRSYLPAEDDPETVRDAAGETLKNPDRHGPDDALKTRDDR